MYWHFWDWPCRVLWWGHRDYQLLCWRDSVDLPPPPKKALVFWMEYLQTSLGIYSTGAHIKTSLQDIIIYLFHSCEDPVSGDGYLDLNEECDDWDTFDTNGSSSSNWLHFIDLNIVLFWLINKLLWIQLFQYTQSRNTMKPMKKKTWFAYLEDTIHLLLMMKFWNIFEEREMNCIW